MPVRDTPRDESKSKDKVQMREWGKTWLFLQGNWGGLIYESVSAARRALGSHDCKTKGEQKSKDAFKATKRG